MTEPELTVPLAAVVERSPVATAVVDGAGTIVFWNRGATLTFGHTADQVVGRPAADLAAPRERATFAALVNRAAAGETAADRHTVWLTDTGTEVEVALTLSPLTEAGDVAVMARDVTEERWLAATLDRSLESLRTALDDARDAEAAARRFLADVAHQLRTPVAGIKASAEVLLSGNDVGELRERLLGNIVAEADRAGRLMASLVRMARLEQGEALVRQPTDVGAACEAAAETARVLAPHLSITCDSGALGDRQPGLDAHALAEILGNLLDNARRYAHRHISVTATGDAGGVQIEVRDDGPGLPSGREADAFERFVRLDPGGGSGLGLAIARSLARAHGGDLTWTKGAFVVRLGP